MVLDRRITIRLELREVILLDQLANIKKKSTSELIREAITRYIYNTDAKPHDKDSDFIWT